MGKRSLENIVTKKFEVLKQIGFQDSKERDAVLTVEESTSKRLLVAEFNKWTSLEEVMRRQKLRQT